MSTQAEMKRQFRNRAEINRLKKKIERLEKKYENAGLVQKARIRKNAVATEARMAFLSG
jgi:hypothetical protein